RLLERVGGRRADVGAGGDVLPDLEVDGAAGVPHPYDRPLRPHEVAAEERSQELDRLVSGEEPLIAVGADRELGDDVAEELEPVGTVDEVPAVVDVRRREPHAQLDGHAFHALTPPELGRRYGRLRGTMIRIGTLAAVLLLGAACGSVQGGT